MEAGNKRVLIAVDGSDDSDRIIEEATQYIDREACSIRMAVVVPPAIAGELAGLHGDAKAWPLGEMQAALESGMTETARGHAQKFDIEVDDVIVLFGRPSEELCTYCGANNIDLVVMGLHRTASHEIGSTTLSLLQRCPCDVLTIRLGEGASA